LRSSPPGIDPAYPPPLAFSPPLCNEVWAFNTAAEQSQAAELTDDEGTDGPPLPKRARYYEPDAMWKDSAKYPCGQAQVKRGG
jgi:hypothetical protein